MICEGLYCAIGVYFNGLSYLYFQLYACLSLQKIEFVELKFAFKSKLCFGGPAHSLQ